MSDYETSLLREKFVINAKGHEMVVLSNRMVAPMHGSNGKLKETYIVRGQNMYSCIRMVSKLTQAYYVGGSLIERQRPLDWDKIWESCGSAFDQSFKPDNWITIYKDGEIIYASGEHHGFLDIIEKFSFQKSGHPYEDALQLAKETFKNSSDDVSVEHDANVALIINANDKKIRCGMTQRSLNRKMTLSFSTELKSDDPDETINLPQYMAAAAAQCEGLQLIYTLASLIKLREAQKIEKGSDEARKLREAQTRMNQLESEISNLETSYKIRYRPEKPQFKELIIQAKSAI